MKIKTDSGIMYMPCSTLKFDEEYEVLDVESMKLKTFVLNIEMERWIAFNIKYQDRGSDTMI